MIKRITVVSLFTTSILYCAASFAQTSANHQEYVKFKSHDRDQISFDNGKSFSYTVISRAIKDKIEVVTAKIDDPLQADLENYNNLIITLDNQKEEIRGFAETSDGHFQIDLAGSEGHVWKKVESPKVIDSILKKSTTSSSVIRQKTAVAAAVAPAALADSEKDAAGNYVIDVFMGFSNQAAAQAGNIEAYAQMQVATVNTALKNSNIQGVYLRLVGVGQVPNNPGIVTSVLDDVKVWFKDDIDRLAPDLIGMQQIPTGATGEAAGWAGVGGSADTQVVGVPWPNAWRHEVGHNVGGWHCKEAGDTGYNYGYSVRPGRATAMCGNDLAYYSSPLIRDNEGNILGTAEGQDMARVWRERMAEMAARRIHKVPYANDSSLPITIQAEDYVDSSDTTAGNQGGAYRKDNVDIEATTDVGGGFNVGWIVGGEWLAYKIVVPTDGNYEFSYRVASLNGGGLIQLEKQGGSPVYGSVTVPKTGGWQSWTTVKHTVALKAGSQNIALAFKAGNFNINSFHIEKVVLGASNYRIQNLWMPDQTINIERGSLASSAIAANLASGQWTFERITDTSYYRIKNRLKPNLLLNIENGSLDATTAGEGWWSAQWVLETVDGTTDQFRIQNRWKPDQYINIEANLLKASTIQPGWWSARWQLIPTN